MNAARIEIEQPHLAALDDESEYFEAQPAGRVGIVWLKARGERDKERNRALLAADSQGEQVEEPIPAWDTIKAVRHNETEASAQEEGTREMKSTRGFVPDEERRSGVK